MLVWSAIGIKIVLLSAGVLHTNLSVRTVVAAIKNAWSGFSYLKLPNRRFLLLRH
jgi:hypothetical protein